MIACSSLSSSLLPIWLPATTPITGRRRSRSRKVCLVASSLLQSPVQAQSQAWKKIPNSQSQLFSNQPPIGVQRGGERRSSIVACTLPQAQAQTWKKKPNFQSQVFSSQPSIGVQRGGERRGVYGPASGSRISHRCRVSSAMPGSTRNRGRNDQNANYIRVGECLVFLPLSYVSRRMKPKAIVHLIGGAFIGAVPEFTYSLFIELLTKEGYLVIATPYKVTFEHAMAAEEVHSKFKNGLSILKDSGFTPMDLSPDDISSLPVFCVGHSNGALLQLLVGSLFQEDLPKGNAVIAFNNKPAADAVPYFEQFGPLMAQVSPTIMASPLMNMARSIPVDSVREALEASLAFLPGYDEKSLNAIRKFAEQVPSVFDQISQGISEFRPTPTENRETIRTSYSVKETLLVKYKVDGIDESDTIQDLLRSRVEAINGRLSVEIIDGNHITPCAQDLKWNVGRLYTPVDAMQQLLRNTALSEIKETVKRLSFWIDSLL